MSVKHVRVISNSDGTFTCNGAQLNDEQFAQELSTLIHANELVGRTVTHHPTISGVCDESFIAREGDVVKWKMEIIPADVAAIRDDYEREKAEVRATWEARQKNKQERVAELEAQGLVVYTVSAKVVIWEDDITITVPLGDDSEEKAYDQAYQLISDKYEDGVDIQDMELK